LNQETAELYQENLFVTFPGYEWSGNTGTGGDRKFFFAMMGDIAQTKDRIFDLFVEANAHTTIERIEVL
jgi:hypothetical protein